jgi:hypothetical protein
VSAEDGTTDLDIARRLFFVLTRGEYALGLEIQPAIPLRMRAERILTAANAKPGVVEFATYRACFCLYTTMAVPSPVPDVQASAAASGVRSAAAAETESTARAEEAGPAAPGKVDYDDPSYSYEW